MRVVGLAKIIFGCRQLGTRRISRVPKISVRGVGLFYEEAGSGIPLVLLHPWPTDHAMWMFQVPVFSEGYRVITPDSRGLGRSDKPKSGYSPTSLADDLEGLLDHLGIEKAFVVGLSLGGAVAMMFTLNHPDRVRASIWVGAPKLPLIDFMFKEKSGRSRPLPDVYKEALKAGGYTNFWNTVWKPNSGYLLHSSFLSTPLGSYLCRYLFEERYPRLNKDARSLIGLLDGMSEDKVLRELRTVKVPVAMVSGTDDPTLPYIREHKKYCPQAEYYEIPKSGHVCTMDQAEEFNRIMARFLRKHER